MNQVRRCEKLKDMIISELSNLIIDDRRIKIIKRSYDEIIQMDCQTTDVSALFSKLFSLYNQCFNLEYAYHTSRNYEDIEYTLQTIASACFNIMADFKIWDDDYLRTYRDGRMPTLEEMSWLQMSPSHRKKHSHLRPSSLIGGRRSLFKARRGHK